MNERAELEAKRMTQQDEQGAMSERETLKPCPFDGGRAVLLPPTCRPETPYNPRDRLFPVVRCTVCYAEAYGTNEDYVGDSAIAAWNRRTPHQDATQQGWRAIESAPRDGTEVLVSTGRDIEIAAWSTFAEFHGPYPSDIEPDPEPRWFAAWGPELDPPPTHWQPLPSPPEAQNG